MFHGVLDERLDRQDRDRNSEGFGIHLNLLPQFGPEPKRLNLEVSFDDPQFFLQWNRGLLISEEVSENIREVHHHLARFRCLPRYESVQSVQRVEKKMGIDLRL